MNTLQANICLIAVTLIWSFEVMIHSVIPEGVNPFATVCVTSLIAALLLGVYFFKRIHLVLQYQRGHFLERIVLLGVLGVTYNVLYLMGLEDFDVSTGAFTTSMTIVFIPVLLLVMHRGIDKRTLVSILIVLVGIMVAVTPSSQMDDLRGLGVMTAGCLVRAVYIVKLNDYAHMHDPITLATGMSAVSAVVAFVPWLIMEPTVFFSLPRNTELIAAYFVYGYFIVALATVLNVYAQRRATAAHATIIYSLEIIFATIWATVLPGGVLESAPLTPHVVIGCLLVLVGNLVVIMRRGALNEKPSPDAVSEVMIQVSHPFAVLLEQLRSPLARKTLLFLALLAVYLIIALPFKVLAVIPGFTDIRPVNMLIPAYGIFFGIPGCLAFAFGNVIGDIASGSLRISSIAGFIANFLYPYMLYVIWTKIRKEPFHLRTVPMLLGFTASLIAGSIVSTAIITPTVGYFYQDVNLAVFALSVLANTFLFPFGFAIPFIVLIQEELGFKPLGPRKAGKHAPRGHNPPKNPRTSSMLTGQ